MKKLQQLREFLIHSVYELKNDPDRLLLKAESGVPVCSMGDNLSTEYRYTARIMILDFASDIDAIMIPILIWISEHQNELLVNPEIAKSAINFEIDVIDNSKVDIAITIPLTERHIASIDENGIININVPPEPQYEPFWPSQEYELQDNAGNTFARWTSADKTGSALSVPYPSKS